MIHSPGFICPMWTAAESVLDSVVVAPSTGRVAGVVSTAGVPPGVPWDSPEHLPVLWFGQLFILHQFLRVLLFPLSCL